LTERGDRLNSMSTDIRGVQSQGDMDQYMDTNRHGEWAIGHAQESIEELQASLIVAQAGWDGIINRPFMNMLEIAPDDVQGDLDIWQAALTNLERAQGDGNETLDDIRNSMEESARLQAESLALEQARRVEDYLQEEFGSSSLSRLREAATGDFSNFSPEQQAQMAQMGFQVDDFIYQSTGAGSRITPIHSQDTFYGAKPGGPIAEAVGGSKGPVTINMYGATGHDMVRTLDMYMKAKGIQSTRPAGRRT